MRQVPALLVALLLLALDGVTVLRGQAPARRLTSTEARNHAGEIARVCGVVVTYSCGDEGTDFDLDRRADRSRFRILIPKVNRRAFASRLEDSLDQRRVCATGRIEPYGARHQIIVTEPVMLSLDNGSAPSPPKFAPGAYHRCDPDVTLPTPIREVKPRYTRDALGAGIQGTVLLQAVVEPNGTVGALRVVRSLVTPLDNEAVVALRQWLFQPGTYLGSPAPVVVSVELSFKIG